MGKQRGWENRLLRRCLQSTVCNFGMGNEPCYKEGAMDGGMQDTSTFVPLKWRGEGGLTMI